MNKYKSIVLLMVGVLLCIVLSFYVARYFTGPKKYEVVLAGHTTQPAELQKAFANLEKDKFVIERTEKPADISFRNCARKETYVYRGNGVQEFFWRRSVPAARWSDGNVYPDFWLTVLSFDSSADAAKHADWIRGKDKIFVEDCWNKTPEKIVVNGATVYILSTRAQMFTTYTEKYGNQLKPASAVGKTD